MGVLNNLVPEKVFYYFEELLLAQHKDQVPYLLVLLVKKRQGPSHSVPVNNTLLHNNTDERIISVRPHNKILYYTRKLVRPKGTGG